MTNLADVNRLSGASKQVVALAQGDLTKAFGLLDLTRPEAAQEALLEIMPGLVREHGDTAAVAAAEWYEEVRAAQLGGSFSASLATPISDAAPIGSVRYASGHLFTDDPWQTLNVLNGAIQRQVLHSSRETVFMNGARDAARPRWARVPTGRKTCAFCEMLASRGYAYASESSAGGGRNSFHDACNCQIVVEFDSSSSRIEGYDHDAMYERYENARDVSGSNELSDIAATLRRLYPDLYTDGVHKHAH